MSTSREELKGIAGKVRATCVQMAYNARESHLSSSLSCVEILTALFGGFLNYCDGARSARSERDRFILSKGHGCTTLYAAMAAFKVISPETLLSYGQTDGALQNHPCKHLLPELEISSGSLGHGLGIAAGMLYGLRLQANHTSRAAVVLSDGECNEGSVWEAAMFAASQKLGNLVAIVDHNGSQAVGRSDVLMGFTCLEQKFRSFGWHAVSVDGHNLDALLDALQSLPLGQDKPCAIIANTVGGGGVSFMEKDQVWFYRTPSRDDLERALLEIGATPLC
jgi:transketolase